MSTFSVLNVPVNFNVSFRVSDTVSEAIEKVSARWAEVVEGIPLAVTSGVGEIARNTLITMRLAYQKSLDESVERIGGAFENALLKVDRMAREFLEGAGDAVIQEIASAGQQIVASTLFSTTWPHLRSMCPHYIVETDLRVTCVFKGYFPQSGRSGLAPWMEISGRQLPLTGTDQELTGSDLTANLFGNCDSVAGYLVIPSRSPWSFRTELVTYPFRIMKLNKSVGKITVEYHRKQPLPDPRPLAKDFYVSSKGSNNGHHEEEEQRLEAEPGWRVAIGSGKIVNIVKRGKDNGKECHISSVVEEASAVYCKVSTKRHKHHDERDSGEVRGTLCCTVYREIPLIDHGSDPEFSLDWKTARAVSHPLNSCRILFTPFGRRDIKILQGTSLNHPYLDITSDGGGFTITTKDPATLKSPHLFDPTEPPVLPVRPQSNPAWEDSIGRIVALVSGIGIGWSLKGMLRKPSPSGALQK